MRKKPHIIIFNPDEMRWDTMGHMGNPAAYTPNLDQFAHTEAVSFEHAYCQNTVCVPSRCSFFTGLYPHTLGHRTMGYLLQSHESSLLKELKEAGYYVWANARNDLVAGEVEGLIESHVSELYYGGNADAAPGSVKDNPRGNPESPEFYSFCNGQLKTDEHGLNYNEDDEDVDAAIRAIAEHANDEKPLCIFVGTLYPHPPYNVEKPYFSDIKRENLPKRIMPEEGTEKAKMLTLLRRYQNLDEMPEEEWDELRAVYLGMCAKVDAQFARLCQGLKQAGIYEDSAIFFLSDHGDYAGDYGVVEKAQNCFEDKLTRVPFLIKPPKDYGVDAGVCSQLVELVDFYATVMDYAGIKPSHYHFGKSLLPTIADRTVAVRNAVFCEGGRNRNESHCSESVDPEIKNGFRFSVMWPRYAAQYDDEAHAKGTMVRTRQWKYIYRSEGSSELYNMEQDAEELHNLIKDDQYRMVETEMKGLLLNWYQQTADYVPYQRDFRFSSNMIWEKVKKLCPEGYEEQVKAKIDETMNLFLVKDYCKKLVSRRGE